MKATLLLVAIASIASAQAKPAPARPAPSECAAPKPGWLWCDDFESDRLSKYFEYTAVNGQFTRAAAVGRDGSFGMSATYTAASNDAGSLKLAIGKVPVSYFRPVDGGATVHREVYWRWYIMHPKTWVGGGPDKMSRATGFTSQKWAQSMSAHVWDGEDPKDGHLHLDPVSGTNVQGMLATTQFNDMKKFRWLGAKQGSADLFDAEHLGRWVCVEAHVKLNDAGLSNGTFDLWVDGKADAQRDGLNWVGAYTDYGINVLFFENFWNNKSPVTQTRYWDNIVVSTQRIGC